MRGINIISIEQASVRNSGDGRPSTTSLTSKTENKRHILVGNRRKNISGKEQLEANKGVGVNCSGERGKTQRKFDSQQIYWVYSSLLRGER